MEVLKKGILIKESNGFKATCPFCSAELGYVKPDVQREWDSNKMAYTDNYFLECPCCNHNVPVTKDKFISNVFNERKKYWNKNPIEVFKEGSFHKEVECKHCHSMLKYDYRDIKSYISMDDYYCSKEIKYIVCPECSYNMEIKD